MTLTTAIAEPLSTGAQLVALDREHNAQQYRIVHLAARYDEELEWFHAGHKNPASWISTQLGIHAATAREWIRVGHALRHLPAIDTAFARNELSYAKVRILTRWAAPENERQLLSLAHTRTADRLTTAISQALADDGETDEERDARLHDARAVTTWTDGSGMTVIRIALPPSTGKPILAAVDELVRRIAATPADPEPGDDLVDHDHPADPPPAEQSAPADRFVRPSVAAVATHGAEDPPADSRAGCEVLGRAGRAHLPGTLAEMRRRWQPTSVDDWAMPSLAQQRADAVVALFLGRDVHLTTEVVIHVRGDGTTFDDGTPTTDQAVVRHLDQAFIRLLIHDAERRPVNASQRRRHPTTAQKRVAMELHGHECVDCQSADLLELDHNPPFQQTGRTITDELEPRCSPCHRAHHRFDHRSERSAA